MDNRTVLISGAGIAGPSLAYWLRRHGFEPTVVERARHLRDSGSAVDFRGEQMKILEAMGILDRLRAVETAMGDEVVVDASGAPQVALPSSLFSGELEVERGDLARVLYDLTRDETEYLFGNWIVALNQGPDDVEVTFADGGVRRFGLVVGADGAHSAVRRLAFGEESRFVKEMGFAIAGVTGPNLLDLDHEGRIYNEPGRGVLVSSSRRRDEAAIGFVFSAPGLVYDRHDPARQRQIVRDVFAGAGWVTPQLLTALDTSPDLYFDTLAQVHMDTWSAGRVVLLGDAAWCAGPGGNGTGMAMMAANVLAGELALADGDHAAAFGRYEEIVRPGTLIGQKQGKGAGAFLAPLTDKKIKQRNRVYGLLSKKMLAGLFAKMTTKSANSVVYRDYLAAARQQQPADVSGR